MSKTVSTERIVGSMASLTHLNLQILTIAGEIEKKSTTTEQAGIQQSIDFQPILRWISHQSALPDYANFYPSIQYLLEPIPVILACMGNQTSVGTQTAI
jgi:hypothetical protein